MTIINMSGGKPAKPIVVEAVEETPSTLPHTFLPREGVDYLSSVTVGKDPNLVPENVKKDVSIFGTVGTYEGSGGTSFDLKDTSLKGYTNFINASGVGEMPTKWTSTSTEESGRKSGTYYSQFVIFSDESLDFVKFVTNPTAVSGNYVERIVYHTDETVFTINGDSGDITFNNMNGLLGSWGGTWNVRCRWGSAASTPKMYGVMEEMPLLDAVMSFPLPAYNPTGTLTFTSPIPDLTWYRIGTTGGQFASPNLIIEYMERVS